VSCLERLGGRPAHRRSRRRARRATQHLPAALRRGVHLRWRRAGHPSRLVRAIVWYAQSRYQLVRRFGPDGAKVLLDATSAMLYSGGFQDAELLRDLSGMLGQLDVRHRSWGADRSRRASWTEQVREVAVMDSTERRRQARQANRARAAG